MFIESPLNSLLGQLLEPFWKDTSPEKRVTWSASEPSGAVVSANLSASPVAAKAGVNCASHEKSYFHDIELNGISELNGYYYC